jgi:glucose/arabinose dehydrogenase
MRRAGLASGILGLLLLACAAPAAAQSLQATTVVTGLSLPIAFVQDPTFADTQYVAEQDGRIRTVRSNVVQLTDFLDLSSFTAAVGERGLLGMAFAPDYATSGRFFVNFTDLAGHTVIARFVRSSGNPRVADPSTRFDLIWPDTQSFIAQPYSNHNGGNLQFGADGYLYIGMGDGGSGNDPEHRAQNPATLLGKFLRINVNVSDSDPEGYDVPADNPFVNTSGYMKEIWSFGWRNPWRWSFDTFGTGATGALIAGDVGQGAREELNYEPANRGGRNYGWRLREGLIATPGIPGTPGPAYTPLSDPIHDYPRSLGATVVGGYVYRGTAMPSTYRGRYFWADFVSGRIWSMALNIGGGGEATASNVTEHTTELGGTSACGNVSSFGLDSVGELYLVCYGNGTIRKISSPLSNQVVMALDLVNNSVAVLPLTVAGWAIDLGFSSATGVDAVHVWAFPIDGSAGVFLGSSYGLARQDVANAYGTHYLNSGYSVNVTSLPAGTYNITAFAHSTVTNAFDRNARALVEIVRGPASVVETPVANTEVAPRFTMGGWAVDLDSTSGTGVDTVHVWATLEGGATQFAGVATYGTARSDIAAAYGSRFLNSGWTLNVSGLSSGVWTLRAYVHSSVTGAFTPSAPITVRVQSGMLIAIDAPQAGAVTGGFQVTGWALDLAHPTSTGVSTVHVWALPVIGGTTTFLGVATIGGNRPDVGAAFGAQFTPSGYTLNVASLASGTYDIVVFAHSTLTGRFELARSVRIQKN